MSEKNSEQDNKKQSSTLDKVIMGAIIGTAIGSAIGISMAPKKGSETRQIIKEKVATVSEDAKEVGILAKETASGFFKLASRLLFGKKNNQSASKQNQSNILDQSNEMQKEQAHKLKKIPNESSVTPE